MFKIRVHSIQLCSVMLHYYFDRKPQYLHSIRIDFISFCFSDSLTTTKPGEQQQQHHHQRRTLASTNVPITLVQPTQPTSSTTKSTTSSQFLNVPGVVSSNSTSTSREPSSSSNKLNIDGNNNNVRKIFDVRVRLVNGQSLIQISESK